MRRPGIRLPVLYDANPAVGEVSHDDAISVPHGP